MDCSTDRAKNTNEIYLAVIKYKSLIIYFVSFKQNG